MSAAQAVLEIDRLPDTALAAAEKFHAEWLPEARQLLDEGLVEALLILLPPGRSDHRDWRQAIARDLAREYSPARVNLVSGMQGEALEATMTYLSGAAGITGQYLEVAGNDAPIGP